MARTTDHELALRVLGEARALLDQPERWTQDTLARNADGHPVGIADPTAVCWCSLGAVGWAARRATRNLLRERRVHAMVGGALVAAVGARLGPGQPAGAVAQWQDKPERTHAEVLALLDEAIATLRRQATADLTRRQGAP